MTIQYEGPAPKQPTDDSTPEEKELWQNSAAIAEYHRRLLVWQTGREQPPHAPAPTPAPPAPAPEPTPPAPPAPSEPSPAQVLLDVALVKLRAFAADRPDNETIQEIISEVELARTTLALAHFDAAIAELRSLANIAPNSPAAEILADVERARAALTP